MPLFRNKSAAPQAVTGAGLAEPGGLLEVPDDLARGLTGPDWETVPVDAFPEITAAASPVLAGPGEYVEEQP